MMPMNVSSLYPLMSSIVNHFSLDCRLRRVLRDFALATLVSRSCLLDDIAHALTPCGEKDSQYRRIQRFLANPRVDVAQLQAEWTRFIIQMMNPTSLTLLVDETALSDHLKIMVLGIWTPGGCVPIAWRSYRESAYPDCGQVQVIANLLDRVRPALPFPCPITLLADRGIGTSPDLIQQVENRGMGVLFRVQSSSRFRYPNGHEVALHDLGIAGKARSVAGDIFKKAGWLSLHATVAWDTSYDAPWCLVSSYPIEATDYANRFDQEVSFRDLKSDGFQWHRSHVWLPDHADRLLLVLAITYWLVMSAGQSIPPATTGRASRNSCFRRGLEICTAIFRPTIALLLPKPPLPPPRITCVVQ
jgi:hypothetical protein